MGSAGVDYLAQVAAYPKPDEKLRTERLEVQGGGNCGNALTAAARLGLTPCIVTKIGDDALGDGILTEFHREGVDTGCVLRAEGGSSPFTYIIVDRQGATRTCIHTAGEPIHPQEMTQQLMGEALEGAAVVYFDGRLTEAAIVLARAARAVGVPVLVEAERLRPNVEVLLQEADYVVTSAHFPENWTGEGCIGDAIAATFARLPRVKWMITTLGKKGSVLLERMDFLAGEGEEKEEEAVVAEELIEGLFKRAAAGESSEKEDKGIVACTSASGVEIKVGAVVTAPEVKRLLLQRSNNNGASSSSVEAKAAAAAAMEASLNAAGSGSAVAAGYQGSTTEYQPLSALVSVSQAAQLPSAQAVLDTTGAGDAFIGSVVYCIATGKSPKDALRLGSVVAGCKCTALGARPGLPRRGDILPTLL